MVPPSLFRSRDFGGANLVTLLFYMALTFLTVWALESMLANLPQ